MPLLKARKALRELAPGATLEVLSSDPRSVENFETFCRSAGHELLEAYKTDDFFCFVIKKGGG